jgi:hypothetical protein
VNEVAETFEGRHRFLDIPLLLSYSSIFSYL